ncbi:MAG: extracellular solute-binding protein [Lachnospira sp.]|nr:extracellular solute-binding protein [Lachnospira sp.]
MKRLISILLCVVMIISVLGCTKSNQAVSNDGASEEGTSTNIVEVIKKPESINILWNTAISLSTKEEKADFAKALSDELGMDVKFTEYDREVSADYYENYYSVLGTAFANNEAPDVVIIDSKHYAEYAAAGYLWDMTNAFEKSELKASGRITAVGEKVIANNYIDGKLYGMQYQRGNGCITYVRTKWLEECGLSAPTNFEEYYNMLVTFKNKYNVAPLTAPGFISLDAPYTNYLPEFYQDAYPAFYKNAEGKWVDGFSEEAMEQAIARIKKGYEAGLFDVDTGTNTTVDCREGLINEEHGVFTYWAGTWSVRLSEKLIEGNVTDSRFTMVKAIEEVNGYVEKDGYVFAISANADNPEGIFEYFIEQIFDGDKVQTLWTYGKEGKQWSMAEGQFQYLKDSMGFLYDTILIDDALSIVNFVNGTKAPIPQVEKDALKLLEDDACYERDRLVGVEKEAEIMAYKATLIDLVVTGEMTYEKAIEDYTKAYGAYVKEVLEKANK